MEYLLTKRTVTITELKASPAAVLREANGQAVAVLNHNRVEAYLVPVGALRPVEFVSDDEALAALKEVIAERAEIIEALANS